MGPAAVLGVGDEVLDHDLVGTGITGHPFEGLPDLAGPAGDEPRPPAVDDRGRLGALLRGELGGRLVGGRHHDRTGAPPGPPEPGVEALGGIRQVQALGLRLADGDVDREDRPRGFESEVPGEERRAVVLERGGRTGGLMKAAKVYPMPSPAARFDPFELDPSSQVWGLPGTLGMSGWSANGWSAGKASWSQARVSSTCCSCSTWAGC